MSTKALDTGRAAKKQLDRDLARYSATAASTLKGKKHGMAKPLLAFGAATSAALLGGTGVEATIIYTVANQTIFDGSGQYISMSVSNDFVFNNFTGASAESAFAPPGGSLAATQSYLQKFSPGQTIGTPGSSLTSAVNSAFLGTVFSSSTGFIGVRTPGNNFGWIQVHVTLRGATPAQLTIIDYAYVDTGAHIRSG